MQDCRAYMYMWKRDVPKTLCSKIPPPPLDLYFSLPLLSPSLSSPFFLSFLPAFNPEVSLAKKSWRILQTFLCVNLHETSRDFVFMIIWTRLMERELEGWRGLMHLMCMWTISMQKRRKFLQSMIFWLFFPSPLSSLPHIITSSVHPVTFASLYRIAAALKEEDVANDLRIFKLNGKRNHRNGSRIEGKRAQ